MTKDEKLRLECAKMSGNVVMAQQFYEFIKAGSKTKKRKKQ